MTRLSTVFFVALVTITSALGRPFEATTLEKLHNERSTINTTSNYVVDTRSNNGGGSGLPASPNGATLVQLKSCAGLSATVPMFVNNQYAKSTQSSAYIVQHGSDRNFDAYFTAVNNIIGNNGIIVAPNNYITTDAGKSGNWYQSNLNLAWSSAASTWSVGADAVGPKSGSNALNGGQCSSYDTYDTILTHLSNKNLFPNLNKVYFVSHSGGGNMVSRYSQIHSGSYPFSFRYIIANPASNAYFTDSRPSADVCNDAHQYPFQWKSTGMPRYVRNRFTTPQDLFNRWIKRDVVTLIGDLDTASRFPGGVEDCASKAEGGTDRRDRNYAWWAYQNILAGTNANVQSFTGYHHLLSSGAKKFSNASGNLNHQNCVIAGVGHDQDPMFDSVCGRAAMTQDRIPAGVGAQYP